jgi:hypothetical protein
LISLKDYNTTKIYTHKCFAKSKEVFSLLFSVQQLEWIPRWEYEMIYSQSGFTEEGCLFKTKALFDNEIIWIATKWDTKNFIANFVGIVSDSLVVKLNISSRDDLDDSANVKWEFIFRAISEKGNAIITNTEEKFNQIMSELEKALNNLLETEKLLKLS